MLAWPVKALSQMHSFLSVLCASQSASERTSDSNCASFTRDFYLCSLNDATWFRDLSWHTANPLLFHNCISFISRFNGRRVEEKRHERHALYSRGIKGLLEELLTKNDHSRFVSATRSTLYYLSHRRPFLGRPAFTGTISVQIARVANCKAWR